MTEDADAEGEINQIVFAKLVTHVVETQRGSTGGVVFKLADKNTMRKPMMLRRSASGNCFGNGNPFEEESPDLYSLDTKDVVESGIADEILKLADKGKYQYRTFLSGMCDDDNPGFLI